MRLLLVEDDDRVAAALSAVLGKHGIDVRHARSGEDAIRALLPDEGPEYDCVLLDLGLPDQDGFEVCSRIRRRTATPVIMVTARADVRSRIHGLNLGADDYVVKPYDTGELLARIHAVSRRPPLRPAGAPLTAPAPAPAGDIAVPPPAGPERETGLLLGPVAIELSTRRVTVDGARTALTRKEFDLLALLAQRPGVVFRREQIISEVWRTAWEGTGRTLEVHVASLRAKLAQSGHDRDGARGRLPARRPDRLTARQDRGRALTTPPAAHRADGRRPAGPRLPAGGQPGGRPAAARGGGPDRRHDPVRRPGAVRQRPRRADAASTRRTTSACTPCAPNSSATSSSTASSAGVFYRDRTAMAAAPAAWGVPATGELHDAYESALLGRRAHDPQQVWPWQHRLLAIASPIVRDGDVVAVVVTDSPTGALRSRILHGWLLLGRG